MGQLHLNKSSVVSARLLGRGREKEIGLCIELADKPSEDVDMYSQTFSNGDQICSHITVCWEPDSDADFIEFGKQLELAASGFWRDLSAEGIEMPPMAEFNMLYTEAALEEYIDALNISGKDLVRVKKAANLPQ